MLRLFQCLGFRPVAIIYKRRAPFHLSKYLHHLEVTLDQAEAPVHLYCSRPELSHSRSRARGPPGRVPRNRTAASLRGPEERVYYQGLAPPPHELFALSRYIE